MHLSSTQSTIKGILKEGEKKMSKKQSVKRILAFFLTLALCFTLLPAGISPENVYAKDKKTDAVSSASRTSGSDSGSSGGSSDAASGATSGSSSNSGNSAVDSSDYDMTAYTVSENMTGPELAAVIDNTPIFYKNGDTYTQLMYYCQSEYSYMFYLYGDSYSDYAAIGYGYDDAVSVRNSGVWSNLYVGTLKSNTSGSGSTSGSSTSGTATYTGTAEVGDEEGSLITLIVTAVDGVISALTADDDNSVGTWGTLLSRRESEYVGQSISSMDYDGVTSATMYSAAIKAAVQDALGDLSDGQGSGSSSFGSSANTSGEYTGTAVTTLEDGDYIIVGRYRSSYDYYALSNDTAGSSGGGYGYAGIAVDSFDGTTATVTDSTGSVVWTWDSSAGSFCNAASGKYLALPSSTYNSAGFFSSSAVALTHYQISGTEATVYNPSGNGGYYLAPAYPSNGKAFNSAWSRYMNSSYLSSGSGVYFCKLETSDTPPAQESSITLDSGTASVETGGTVAVAAVLSGCTVSGVTTSDANIAAASYSDGIVTITGVAAGTATITVAGAGSDGYSDPESQTITVTVTEVTDPVHVKSYDSASESIKLSVTGKDTTVTTTSTTQGETTIKGTNLVLVIDISGSIVGKEEALNSAIQSLVTGLPSNSQVGVVTFNETASSGTIYTADTISGLSFSGVSDAGTMMATGITSATSLLGSSGWIDTDNDQAMVIISDFDADDYAGSITAAHTAKEAGINIYSVSIDRESVSETTTVTELDSDSKDASVAALIPYVSGNYPNATAVNRSMFGIFNQATVTPGGDVTTGYVFGAGGGNWSEIFSEIKTTQGITTTTTTTAHMQGVVIEDTLSEYVDLTDADSTSCGVTVTDDTGAAVDSSNYTVTYDGDARKVTVAFANDYALTADVIYTVNIPVTANAAAQAQADASDTGSVDLPTNSGAALTYKFGSDGETKSTNYTEEPTITVISAYTVTWKDGAATLETDTDVTSGTAPSYDGETPTKKATDQYTYTFAGWSTEADQETGTAAEDLPAVTADITYYAAFSKTEKTFTITWKDDDGTVLRTDENVAYGTTPSYGETPTKDSTAEYTYTFSGWEPAVAAATADAAYTATYGAAKNSYNVTFNANGHGAAPETQTVEYGSKSSEPDDPTAEGWSFGGWYTDAECTDANVYDFDTAVTGAVTLYAKWTQNSYTVTFRSQDGSETLAEETVAYGNKPSYSGTPTKEATEEFTYAFAGWATETDQENGSAAADLPAVTGDVTYYAAFAKTARTYTVTFFDEDGQAQLGETQTVEYGGTPSYAGETPEKAADETYTYAFAGWKDVNGTLVDLSTVEVHSDLTYTAAYTATYIDYTVSFTYYAADGTTVTDSKEDYHYGDTVTVPTIETTVAFDAVTYTFDKWDPTVSATVTGDAAYTATYAETTNTFNVYWVSEGATIEEDTVEYGTVPSFDGETPAKAANDQYTYTFLGWNTDSAAETGLDLANETVTTNTTYYAIFSAEVNKYSVSFVDFDGTALPVTVTVDGESVSVDSVEYPYGTEETAIAVPADPTRDADAQYTYTFAGWTPAIAAVTGETVYTATYTQTLRSYTVKFVNEDGESVIDTQTVAYGGTPTAVTAPEKAGDAQYSYTFAGWKDADGTIADPTAITVQSDLTYTASYEQAVNTYRVTFVNDDGTTVLDEQTLEYGATPVYAGETPETTKAQAGHTYAHVGWTPDIVEVTGDAVYVAKYSDSTNTYTVRFVDEDGRTLIGEPQTVAYGEMPTVPADPTKADVTNQYTYTFTGWLDEAGNAANPAETAVTADVTYKAGYTAEQTGWHIIVEDYTQGGATTSLVSDRYYDGTVSFTVSADRATVLAEHVGGTAETVMVQEGTFVRMHCTANDDGSYTFTVKMPGDKDVYLVMGYKGDADLNARCNIRDSSQMQKAAAQTVAMTALQKLVADVDVNGSVNVRDASQSAREAAQTITYKWDIS